ncbi:Dipeptide-binding ABC transporter, periplasmic substrate-binding component (TC 3.A.1.5.2) [Alloactinosynnema sp. L-07]|uniref:basic amino acid ABC transporter substrate-binding protein n=1 Tax=Alloactinosynnema sp. L-07 TaxID=1653480 RepID=UPI00065EF608|nr:basic amino acid ABC transporter substrate-binding protein [Alloactinosynnema sp. L-07]CRK60568.1 Dipeptide-binding ABC transporter, periplasmic substrate-binding component (TC 3.A.1.5.2) [Alloactinosynnema sp. L-07]
MLRSKLKVFALVPALALAVAAAGCGKTDTPSGGSTTGAAADAPQLIKSGKLLTCTGLPYEPFQFEKDGKVIGFDVDLVDLVAKKINVTQEIIDTPFDGIQSGVDLNSGKCDLAAAGMTITDTRKQNFDFSDPYFDATQALVSKKGSGIKDLAGLSGKKLAVQNGTTGMEYAQKNAPGVELVTFEDLGLLLTAVETGQVAAGINDNGVLFDWAKKKTDFEVVKEFATGEQYGIGVKKGNDKLLKLINSTLADAKKSGEYDKIYEKWFGKKPGSN